MKRARHLIRPVISLAITSLVWVSTSIAVAGTLAAELDRTEGSIDDRFELSLSIEGSRDSELEVPEVPGLIIEQRGQRDAISFINGRMRTERQLSFVISAQQSGTFTIPSFRMKLDGQDEASLPLTLQIHANGRQDNTAQAPTGSPASKERAAQAKKDTGGVFVERECSLTKPYVGEQVSCAVRIYHRSNLIGGQRLSQSSADFRLFNAEGEKRYQRIIGNQRFDVIELNEIVVPTKAGKLELPPFKLEARVFGQRRQNRPGGFFEQFGGAFNFNFREEKEVILTSEALTFEVKALPEQGKPQNFQDLTGDFVLTSDSSKQKLTEGETVTITINLQGKGLLDNFVLLDLPFENIGRIYPDKPEYSEDIKAGDGIYSSRTLKYAVVAKQAGTHTLGVIEVPVFNPATESYLVLKTDLGQLIVEPGQAEQKPVVVGQTPPADSTQQDVQLRGQDLIAAHRQVNFTASHELTTTQAWSLAVAAATPLGLALSFMGFGIYQKRRLVLTPAARHEQAFRNFITTHAKATSTLAAGKSSEALSQAYEAFRHYLGERFDKHAASLTRRDVEACVESCLGPLDTNSPQQALESVLSLVERVTFADYAVPPEKTQAALITLEDIVRKAHGLTTAKEAKQ